MREVFAGVQVLSQKPRPLDVVFLAHGHYSYSMRHAQLLATNLVES